MSNETGAMVKKLLLPFLAATFALAGCGPAGSGSLGAAPTGTVTRTPARPSLTPSARPPATTPASSPQPATSPVPAPSPSATASGCSEAASALGGGTLMICPGAAPVGATVTITSNTTCGAGPGSEPLLTFLGPKAYIGSGGGGEVVPFTKAGKGFTATYRIPSTYMGGGNVNPMLPVVPGSGYSFATYPASGCEIPFTVTP
jgi:hypothetical protein